MTVILHLPWPPSSNHANKIGRKSVFPSKEMKAFLAEADGLAYTQKPFRCIVGPFTYHLVLNREKRRHNSDGENRIKHAKTASSIAWIMRSASASLKTTSWQKADRGRGANAFTARCSPFIHGVVGHDQT